MSIEKISDNELELASVRRLASRPNEVTRYGQKALTADELKDAFDAMGRLNAKKYNALIDSLKGGELADKLRLANGKTLAVQMEDIEDEIEEAKDFFTPMTPHAYQYNTGLCYESYGMRAYHQSNRIVVMAGSKATRGTAPLLRIASFPIEAGVTYYVSLMEDIKAYYTKNTGHISDGGRLRIIEDIGSNGSEDYVHKLTNFGNYEGEVHSTQEPVVFTATGNGTANITLSIYNNNDRYTMPWETQNVTLTPVVYQSAPIESREDGTAYVLALDNSFVPKWHRFNTVGTGTLSATYTKAEINQKMDALTEAIIALGGNL